MLSVLIKCKIQQKTDYTPAKKTWKYNLHGFWEIKTTVLNQMIHMTHKEASKNGYTIDIHKNVFDNVQSPDNISYKVINEKTEEKKKKNTVPTHVIISFPTDNSEFYNYVESIILYKLAHYRTKNSTFSCCSKFHQCSNEKKCVHENKLYSTACTYRKNLDNGRIFYGQNRNVD